MCRNMGKQLLPKFIAMWSCVPDQSKDTRCACEKFLSPAEDKSLILHSRISTYGDRGTAKSLVEQSEHAIIYTGDKAPTKLPEEKNLTKDPMQVVPVGGHHLEDLSRVNFAKQYPVEHNVKVLEVGRVASHHLRLFLGYWQNETMRGFPSTRSEKKIGSSKGHKATPGRRRHA